jgi:PAS domain S-box-containing protein
MTINHTDLISEVAEQYRPVLENSPDGVYLWLDETNKVCNEKLARIFGYSVAEWRRTEPFLESFVAPEDRELYARHYQSSVASLTSPVTFRFRGLRKDGTTFAAETDMIPICWQGHAIAYHFVREIKD